MLAMRTVGSWLISVGAGYWQVEGISRARLLGYKILAIDEDPNAPGLSQADEGHCTEYCLSAVSALLNRLGINPAGVVTFGCEGGVLLADSIARRYHLTRACRDPMVVLSKSHQRNRLSRSSKVKQPGYCWFHGDAVPMIDLKEEVIVKPDVGAGSRGVSMVRSRDDWPRLAQKARDESSNDCIVVEQFLRGTEYTIDGFSFRDVAEPLLVMRKEKIGFVSSRLVSVSRLSAEWAILADTAKDVAFALGMRNGAWHAEIIMTERGPYLIELAARGGGFGLWDQAVMLSTGCDLVAVVVDVATGATGHGWSLLDMKNRAVVMEFIPTEVGKLKQFFVDRLHASCVERYQLAACVVRQLLPLGFEMDYPTRDGDRVGMILAVGDTVADAEESCKSLRELVDLHVE